MATTQDLNILRYGVADGHQPQAQPLQSAVSVYIGQFAITRGGYLIQPDTLIDEDDYVWGVINGQDNSQHTISSPIAGGTIAGLHILGIDTGSFYFTPGTSSDALTQADVGTQVYAIDGNTVGKTNGGGERPVAGILENIGSGPYTGLVAVKVGTTSATGSP